MKNIEHSSPYRIILKESLQREIKEFLYIVGALTTNHDLMRYAKMLKIKNFYVAMSDEVEELPKK